MADRFSLEGPGDLMRNFNASRYGRLEYGCRCIFAGDSVDVRWCELHSSDAGDEPENQEPVFTCAERRRIAEAAQTVGELCDRIAAHKLVCRECGGAGTVELPEAA